MYARSPLSFTTYISTYSDMFSTFFVLTSTKNMNLNLNQNLQITQTGPNRGETWRVLFISRGSGCQTAKRTNQRPAIPAQHTANGWHGVRSMLQPSSLLFRISVTNSNVAFLPFFSLHPILSLFHPKKTIHSFIVAFAKQNQPSFDRNCSFILFQSNHLPKQDKPTRPFASPPQISKENRDTRPSSSTPRRTTKNQKTNSTNRTPHHEPNSDHHNHSPCPPSTSPSASPSSSSPSPPSP